MQSVLGLCLTLDFIKFSETFSYCQGEQWTLQYGETCGSITFLYARTHHVYRYNEAVHSLKQPQDMPWQASALEGIVVAGVIDCWLSGHSFVCASIIIRPSKLMFVVRTINLKIPSRNFLINCLVQVCYTPARQKHQNSRGLYPSCHFFISHPALGTVLFCTTCGQRIR